MSEFTLQFNLDNYHQLDEYALLSCQAYNFGNDSDWFGSFRGGLYGSYARIHGLCSHYHAVHAWMPMPRLPSETEYHLASLFFNMDSFIECITYALNAFGYCASGNTMFRDVTCAKGLRRISPCDILGRPNANPPQSYLAEYDTYFPEVRKYWESKSNLINMIFEQHDVSKHRETIFVGGKCRTTPPPGFFESIGIGPNNASQNALFWPMEEIIIQKDPKIPKKDRTPQPVEGQILLESLVPEFQEFAEKTGELALSDAKTNIKLKVTAFKKA
jgi:hypothetical protein